MHDRGSGKSSFTIAAIAFALLFSPVAASAQSAGLSVIGSATFEHADLGDASGVDDSFGNAVAVGDFDGDGVADLAIGDPHDDTGGLANRGAVHILYGGFAHSSDQTLRQGVGGVLGNGEADDQFGGSLAVGNFDGDAYDDLAVAAPFEDIGAIDGAGSVIVFYGSASGLRTDNEQDWHQDVAGVLGVAELADQFGGALAAGDFNGDTFDDLAIGVPWQDLSGQLNAGMVNVLPGSASGLTATGDLAIGQDLASILDTAEFNDNFGASLAAGDFNGDGRDDLAIGIPNEEVNLVGGAGAVAALYGHASLLLDFGSDEFWHQDVAGVLGVPAVNVGWGWALAACDFNNDGRDDLAVSLPGATESGSANAGVVQVLPGLAAAGDTLWAQGFNLPGTAGVGDRLGESLACGDFNGDSYADLAMAAPFDDDAEGGSVTDAGQINVIYGSLSSGLTSTGAQSFDRGNASIGSPATANDRWASALAAGDMDGNGYADLAIGMVPISNDGEVDLLRGGTDIDTDSDGLSDWQEENLYFSSPNLTDSDSDGLDDGDEVNTHSTNPIKADSDADGLRDGFEVANGFDPLDDDENTNGTADGQDDDDADGLGNAAEDLAGTDPNDSDSDDDGALDGAEIGTGAFGAPQVISNTATGASWVFSADLDGDGDADVLLGFLSSIGWFENTDGAGNFGSLQTISALTSGIRSVHAADLDRDGDLDALSASASDNEIAWYENTNGLGSFGSQQIISNITDQKHQSVSAADLDGDGDAEVLSASELVEMLAWYENTDGEGSFGSQNTITTETNFLGTVIAADIDGDEDLDVLSASEAGTDTLNWYENTDGKGTFGPRQVISGLADQALDIFAADVDGDGDIDVLSATDSADEIAWFENTDGAGTFGTKQVITTSAANPQSVFATDVDGDGDIDALSASSWDDTIAWYENMDGAGTFGSQQVISNLVDGTADVFAADIDGDGDIDVLSANPVDDEVVWFRQTNVADPLDPDSDDDGMQDGFEISHGFDPLDDDENTNGIPDGLDDTDSDGLGNIAEAFAGTDPNDSDSDDDGLLDGQELGTGSFGAQQVITNLDIAAYRVAAGDLDGDGDADVLSTSLNDDTVGWYENTDGAGAFGAIQALGLPLTQPSSVVPADLDHDGDLDILAGVFGDGAGGLPEAVFWYENTDGAGNFSAPQLIFFGVQSVEQVVAADVDGDGDLDVLSASGGDHTIAWYENTDGNGSFGSQQVISFTATGAQSIFAVDLDGDGDVDVVASSLGDDTIGWFENTDGLGSFGTRNTIQSSAGTPETVVAADIDRDGDQDVVAGLYASGEVAWWENTDGAGTFGTKQSISTDMQATSVRMVIAADVEGDGDIDVLAALAVDDELVWFENTDGAGAFAAKAVFSTLVQTPTSIAMADIDADGDLDALSGAFSDVEVAWYPQSNYADPNNPDSDGDGLCDGPPSALPACTLGGEDTNGNGIYDVGVETDPNSSDTDGDGLSDGAEIAQGSDPISEDSDSDGVCDGSNSVGSCTAAGPDNCPLVANPAQTNGDAAPAGDGCQCGDIDASGTITASDVLIARKNLVGASQGAFDFSRCNVIGASDLGATDCNVADIMVMERVVDAKPVAVGIDCSAHGAP